MSEQPIMPRFYGGHYDSVKQAAYRDFLVSQQITVWHEELRRRYTARLRLDILLGANIVLTDAQFYDGLLFHTIVSSETHRKDFYEFLRRAKERLDVPLVEVRRRKRGLLEMFEKPFAFNSLITQQAKDQVKEAMQKVLKRAKAKRGKAKSYKDWKPLMQDVVNAIQTQSAKELMRQVIEAIALLNEAPSQIFKDWEPDRVNAYPQLLKEAKSELKFEVPRTGNKEIDETLTKVEKEMAKERPIRSNIEKWIRDCQNADPPDNSRQNILNGVWNQVLQVYNRAIANQHRCISMDLGETLLDSQDVVAELHSTTIGAIADLSWIAFWEVLSRDPLAQEWKKWRDIICEPHRFKDKDISTRLENLVSNIEKSVKGSTGAIDMIVGGGSSTLTFSANGLSLSFEPIKLIKRIKSFVVRLKSSAKEKFNLVRHGMRILDLASKN